MKVDANASSSRSGSAPRRGRGDTLGVAWVHGLFQAAIYRRQGRLATWTCPDTVDTVESFAAALDGALEALGYGGTEVFLLLAHDEFVHQLESVPAFSESAARTYLRNRVGRFEKEHGPVLWVSQRAASVRKEGSHVLHLLPGRFYEELHQAMRLRRLDLTRIVPLLVALQHELTQCGDSAGPPLLMASAVGRATAVTVGRPDGQVFFTRTTLASWRDEPARVAVEVNRSLLYAKQQFASVIDRIWLLGEGSEAARPEVEAKCGSGKDVSVRAAGPQDWLDAIARLPARHPVNLVASYLRQKRRQRFFRRVFIAACWLGLSLLAIDLWNRDEQWVAESYRLASLRADEADLQLEHQRLSSRNAEFEQHRVFLGEVIDQRLAPVPGRFLAYVASLLPREARLSTFSVKWEETTHSWDFRFEGTVEADAETARAVVATLRRQLATGPLKARLLNTVRGSEAIATGSSTTLHRFSVEGGLDER